MKRFLGIIVINLFLFAFTLNSQQSFVIATATQNVHYKFQRWKTSKDFPEEYIAEYKKQGFFVTSLQNYNNFWTVVISKTSVIKEQLVVRSNDFPDEYINGRIYQGWSINSICYSNKEWFVVMDLRRFSRKEEQEYYYGLRYPKEEIKKANEKGYYVSKLQYNNGYWIALFSRDSDAKREKFSQEVLTIRSFDDVSLKTYLNGGWHISDMTFKDGIVVLLTDGLNWGRQDNRIVLYSNMSEVISNWWNYKYSITNLITIYDVILNVSSADNSEYVNKFFLLSEKPTGEDDARFIEFIEDNKDTEVGFRGLQKLAGVSINDKKWDKGIAVYEKYRSKFPSFKDKIDKIVAILKADAEGVKIENLGENINSEYNDYFPIITLEGKRLYFCSFNREDGYGGEDIYYSDEKNGVWQKAVNIGMQINTGSHEAPLGISADNLELTVFGNYSESFGNGDIFYYKKMGDNWSERKHYDEPINSPYFDSDVCFSSDGNAIFFVSDRPYDGDYDEKDNFSKGIWGGNLDIYVTVKTDSGWSDAINLGKTINTRYIDRSPFLHPDGKTLYFSSSGHTGLGGLDVFKSTRLSQTSWTEWSEPVNLGKEINTYDNDWGYKISLDGNFAYFSAFNNEDTTKKQDIFKIRLPKKARPDMVATIKGRVVDAEGKPLSAKIKWENLSTGEAMGELNSDPIDGSFFVVLPIGKKYGYYAEKEGYYPVSKNIDLTRNIDTMLTLYEDVVLLPIKQIKEKNISIRINNLFFDFNSSELLSESYPELNRLIKFLEENPDVRLEISGYTDDIGSERYNKKLSIERAKAVMNYLVSKGINQKLLTAKGYGKSNPVSQNQTDDGRALNRRVEIKIIDSKK
ncbi:hypothetical protein D9V86_04080 [Bacteroidetes/Chlorobi group bacterium ChocPot_Mid]|nr:MAG: hypothetical protein D9V86_04080 [Bacteroidetes/Chlorobi group bacterium ChocPot_Mid]